MCIWDLRNLKSRVNKLSGHKSWVKNIEFSRRDNLIVTSGLDGSIYTWDINRGSGESGNNTESRYQKIFHTPGLMRCRISNDETKMIICTTGGYLIIVNDLNLTTLAADLKGFRPNIHRLMQLGDQYFPIVSEFKHVFDSRRRRNRVELISDFPEKNDAEVICSLAIHPHNWVALSRNMNADEQSEWTCVHDIQEIVNPFQKQKYNKNNASSSGSNTSPFNDQEDEYDVAKKRVADEFTELREMVLDHVKSAKSEASAYCAKMYLNKVNSFLTLLGHPTTVPAATSSSTSSSSSTSATLPIVPSTSFDMWAGQVTDNRMTGTSIGPFRSGLISGRVVEDPDSPEMTRGDRIYFSSSEEEDEIIDDEEINSSTDASENELSSELDPTFRKFYAYVPTRLNQLVEELKTIQKHMNNKYKANAPRLLYYAQESNAGKGFIKELCFNSDGRVIASPQGNGVRLLGFNEHFHELSNCVDSWDAPQKPRALTEVSVDANCHPDLVVCTKFSPNYPLLVSGCVQGNVVWHYPNI